MLVRGVYKIKG